MAGCQAQEAIRAKCFHPSGSFIEFKKEEVEQSIPQRFEKIVRQYPDQVAIKMADRGLTYKELNQGANRIAHILLSRHGEENNPIALLCEHGIDIVVAILGVLKAGKCYIALDPTSPVERIEYILEDSRVDLLITNNENHSTADALRRDSRGLLNINELNDSVFTANPGLAISPRAITHITYTSGSTGTPKGVLQTHRNLLNEIMAYTNGFHICTQDRSSLLASCGSGQGVKNAFSALLNGACLFPFNVKAEGVSRLAQYLIKAEITLYHSSVTLYRQLVQTLTAQDQFPNLRLVRLASQQVLKEDVESYKRHFSQNCILVNALSSTETGTFCWYFMNRETPISDDFVPVGYELDDKSVVLFAEDGHGVGADRVGEIAVKSQFLSPGYWRNPDLTRSKFLGVADSGDERVYHTGDLGRFLFDGCLVPMGRKDLRVKIRGYAVDIAEIENAIKTHAQVREVGVAAWDREPGDKYLVGYIVPDKAVPPAVGNLVGYLKRRLPDYMIPSAFVFLEKLPITNGRLDRSALPLPDHKRPDLGYPYIPPQNDLEQKLVQIWEEVLDVSPIGIHDNFFDLGGHSLLGARLISRLHEVFHRELPLRSLFEKPTVSGLAEDIQEAREDPGLRAPSMLAASRGADLPLSFSQQRLWFLDQLEPESPAYNLFSAFRLTGELNVAALEQSFNEILRRHEVLRTVFKSVDGQPHQIILPSMTIRVSVVDLREIVSDTERESEVCRLSTAEAQRHFDLAHGPLLRASLLWLTQDKYILLLAIHHIVFDGWSRGILAQELSALYEAFSNGHSSSLLKLPIQYADFAQWQRKWLQGDVVESQIAYWKKQLDDVPTLQLPTDRPRPQVQTARGARQYFVLSETLSIGLKSLSNCHGVTLFMTLLAAYQTLLHRYTGQNDIVIGSPVAGRNRSELEGLIGFFLNMLVLRTDLSGNPTFRELLARVREVCLEAYAHQDLPFEKLVEEVRPERKLRYNPLFQVTFALQNTPRFPLGLTGLKAQELEVDAGIARFDLHLFMEEKETTLHGHVDFNTDLFNHDTINRTIRHFQTLLKAIVENPEQRISQLPMLTEPERHQSGAAAARHDERPLQRVPREGNLPLSFAQQRLWFIDQLEPNSALYNVARAFRICGALDVAALEQSLNEIVHRHEALRTTFPSADGRPLQRISPSWTIPLPVWDLTDRPQNEREEQASRLANEEARRPFNLVQGPLFRVVLIRLAPKDHLLLVSMHHIVSDGWSMGVLHRELSALYNAFADGRPSPLTELPVQYVDFAQWQRQWLRGEVLERQLSYWKQQLRNLPVLQLPTDRPRPVVQSYRGARQSIVLPQELTEALKLLSQRERASLFMTLLAAFKILLHRYSGQDDFAIGTPIAGRNRVEIEGLIGFFVNTLVLRTDLSGNPTFRELLGRVREVALEAYAQQDLPFEKLVEEIQPERNLGHAPFSQVMFAFQNFSASPLQLSGLTSRRLEVDAGTAKFDFTLRIDLEPSGMGCLFEYNTDLFDGATIVRMLGHFQTLLEGIAADPNQRLSGLPILTDAEREQLLVEWNDTKRDYAKGKCIHELFEAQVKRSADAIAVVFEDQQLNYEELNQRANQLAHYLRKLGVGPEVLVGICVERSVELVVGLLGILKAGGAYVPLDASYPKERLAFMLEDSRAPVLITQQRLIESLPTSGATLVCLDEDWERVAKESDEDPNTGATAENLAYVIYTSGSTGRPKGVMISHGGISNHMLWMQEALPLSELDRVLQKTPFSFDASMWEFYAPLLAGARLIMAPPQAHQDIACLVKILAEQQVTVLQLVPSMLSVLVEEEGLESCQSLRRVFCGGEVLPFKLTERFSGRFNLELYNLYGPTEATIDTTCGICGHNDGQSVSIGRPISNTKVYLLDSNLNPVPIGVSGEVHVGGAQVARGYLKRPDMTAERFIPDLFGTEPGERLYRTGDLARYLPDGSIEFLGRIDDQVKIRGFRIELGEIESVLGRHPQVGHAVVLAREDSPGEKRLVGYVVPGHAKLQISELRDFLKQKLPDHMVPSAFVFLNSLPLTPNGKIDRRALPPPDQNRPEMERAFAAPRTPIEKTLAKIWAEVLKLKQVGIHDNFFNVGGHSLLATQVISRARDAFQVKLPVRTLFEKPTVADLAVQILLFQSHRAVPEEIGEAVADLESLTDEEAQRLLAQESPKEI